MTSDQTPDETAAARELMQTTGLSALLNASRTGVEFESPEDLIARLKARDAERAANDDLASRRRRRRWATSLAGAAAAVSTTVLFVFSPWSSPRAVASIPPVLDYEFAQAEKIATATGRDAQQALLDLADAAAAQPAPNRSGPVQHVVADNWFTSRDADDSRKTALIPTLNENWLRPDGSRRTVERRSSPLSPDGRGVPTSGDWDDVPAELDETLPAGVLDPEFVDKLPREADDARDVLLDEVGCESRDRGSERTSCLFIQVRDLPHSYVMPPAAMSTLWRVLSDEAGLSLLGKVTDRAGRPGIGIAFISDQAPQYREILIADPSTGALLGTEKVLIKNSPDLKVKAPAIANFTAFIEAEYTDQTGPS